MSLFNELKRRNVFRVGIAYLLGAWVLLQAADFGLQVIDAPNWILQVLVLVAAIGLPAVLLFAWVFEMTPEGLKRESEIDRTRSVTDHTGRKLDRTIIVFLAVAVVVLLIDRFLPSGPAPAVEVATPDPTKVSTRLPEQDARDTGLSIAVLPFVNMSSDPEQEYFSDGLAEELLNRLAKVEQLRVAARTSSFQFKGQNLDIAEIGRQLKVDHVLEGSVRQAGDRLRVTAQLIDVDGGFHLWSESYERKLDDVFVIQDEISGAITGALKLELGVQEEQGRPTENLAAYQSFLEARYLLAKRGADNMRQAISLFDRAIELDPTFARAYSGAAITWSLLPGYGGAQVVEAMQRVKELTARALDIDPNNPEPYLALGRLGIGDSTFEAKQQNFEKAYQLAPNDVDVVNLYGDFLFNSGQIDEAEAMERRAVELDPLAAVHHSDLAFVLMVQGKKEEALDYARTSARLAPDVVDRLDPLIFALAVNGLFDEATRLIDHASKNLSGVEKYLNAWHCFLAYQQGNLPRLRELVQKRIASSLEFNFNTYSIAAWYTLWLEGGSAAVPLLERALDADEYMLTWPEFFYLPELLSSDAEYLAFWEQPALKELMDIRRANWNGQPMGYWKEPPGQ